jgi:hypothetical protein
MARTVARSLAAFAVLGVSTFGIVTPSHAAPPGPGCKPENGKPAYPPGQCKKPGITPHQANNGDNVSATSGEGQFDSGSKVKAEMHSITVLVGTVTALPTGEATISFAVPASVPAGNHTVTFTGTFFGVTRTVTLPLVVSSKAVIGGSQAVSLPGTATGSGTSTAASSSGTGGGAAGLPLTGLELGLASAAGLSLVGGGAALMVAGRRRRGLATA